MRLAVACLAALAACAPSPTGPVLSGADHAPSDARLVVFVQPDEPVDAAFVDEELAGVRMRAAAVDPPVPVVVVDASRGAPPEVTVTPLMVMDTPRGRSIFQGRAEWRGRLTTFLQTARRVAQAPGGMKRHDVGAWRYGRAWVAAPVKVAPVTGTRPDDLDDAAFDAEARRAIARGFRRFEFVDTLHQARADRAFYMDFYPWRADDGTLYLSLALYSQFHCKEPIFATPPDAPLVGPWSARGRLFEEGARRLEQEVVRQVGLAGSGDAFSPIPRSLPTTGWDDLGLPPLDARGASRDGDRPVDAGPLPTSWTLEPEASTLQFHLAAPLDGYAGVARDVRADVTLVESADGAARGTLRDASGSVTVSTEGVTMGEADLDEAVHGSAMLRVSRHPRATFTFDDVAADGALDYGRLTPASARGTLTVKGASVPLDVTFEVEPTVGDDGRPRLVADGTFSFRLRDPFDIVGLYEPMPAADTIEFDFAFRFVPSAE